MTAWSKRLRYSRVTLVHCGLRARARRKTTLLRPLHLTAALPAVLFGCNDSGGSHAHAAQRSAPAITTGSSAPDAEPIPAAPDPLAAPRGMINGCSSDMVRIEGYCIDRYEAHLVIRSETGRYSTHSPYERPEPSVLYEARSDLDAVPQAYISRTEADAACQHAGKRLCRLSEWYRACTGPEGTAYPYGRRHAKGRCNTGKPHLLSLRFGTNATLWKYNEQFNDPTLNQEPNFLAKTGAYPECVGPDGVYDMVGNLHEWVADFVDRSLPLKIPLTDGVKNNVPELQGHGIFMGGFFSTSQQLGRGCRYLTPGHEPGYHDYSTGFRCCRDAEK